MQGARLRVWQWVKCNISAGLKVWGGRYSVSRVSKIMAVGLVLKIMLATVISARVNPCTFTPQFTRCHNCILPTCIRPITAGKRVCPSFVSLSSTDEKYLTGRHWWSVHYCFEGRLKKKRTRQVDFLNTYSLEVLSAAKIPFIKTVSTCLYVDTVCCMVVAWRSDSVVGLDQRS